MKQSLIMKIAYLTICVTFMASKGLELFSQSETMAYARSMFHLPAPHTLVIAHRGASNDGPENSLAAYKQAISMHADYVELDLQMTKDGDLVVMHDESLARTTNARELFPQRSPWLVKDFSLQEISRLDAGSWFNQLYKRMARREYCREHPPSLVEVVRLIKQKGNGKVGLSIDIKASYSKPGIEESLIKMLRKAGIQKNKIIFESISERTLRNLKELAPDAKVVQLYSRKTLKELDTQKEFKQISSYAAGVGPSKESVVPGLVKDAHENGLAVYPWTVNKQEEMRRLLLLGVDGIITNKPDLLARMLDTQMCSFDPECN